MWSKDNSAFPTLSRLMSWFEMSFSEFNHDKIVFGFNFEKRELEREGTNFIYQRRLIKAQEEYTERLIYSIRDDSTVAAIAFITVCNSDDNLASQYKTPLEKNQFVAVECNGAPKKGESFFCFRNDEYDIKVSSSKIKYYVGNRRNGMLVISKRVSPEPKD